MLERSKEMMSPEMNTNWSFGAGDYVAQRQLDYKLVNGILRKVSDDLGYSRSYSENRKDN
jgi:hypothetical protein